ncbi:MAG: 50S ribosomal subunit protein L16 [Candidatus Hodgkinia cicadicola]|nr:MAG: 50S ribosomal subunit protein L16 [Candidatus Hodgkinia cicadicola]
MIFQSAAGKHKKQFKGRLKLKSEASNLISFGAYGLKANSSARIDAHQTEAARKAIMKYVKRIGKLWIRVLSCYASSEKPTEVRTGEGKAEVSEWVFRVNPVESCLKLRPFPRAAAFKLSIETSFVSVMQKPSC